MICHEPDATSVTAALQSAPAYEGLVDKRTFELPSYTTVGGATLREVRVGWESYGRLNQARDNVILVPHHYSANSHAAGKYRSNDALPGYWDSVIGPGKPLDTSRFCVISVDSLVNLNAKDGVTVTTGPSSIDPATGRRYGLAFPVVTLRDFVRVQKALMDALGITRLHAVAGVSMGGHQAYEWAAAYPAMVARILPVNATPSQSAYTLVVLEAWTAPIKADPHWRGGDYYGGPEPLEGVAQALYNIMAASLHPEQVASTYGYRWADAARSPFEALDAGFASVSSLNQFAKARARTATDANDMLLMARANELFIAGTPGSSIDADLANLRAATLVVQSRTDLLYPPAGARHVVEQLRSKGTDAQFVELDAPGGHLSGITDLARVGEALRAFLTAT